MNHRDPQSHRIHGEEGDQREQRNGDDEPRVGHEIDRCVLFGSELNGIADNNRGKIGEAGHNDIRDAGGNGINPNTRPESEMFPRSLSA